MNDKMIRAQSEAAYKQWAPQWRKHTKENSIFEMKSIHELENHGVGRAVLCVANGYSFEENIETIKKYQHNVDIFACDKTMGHLLDNGITPKFVMMCDANVDYEKYMAPYKDKLQDIILIANICGTQNGQRMETGKTSTSLLTKIFWDLKKNLVKCLDALTLYLQELTFQMLWSLCLLSQIITEDVTSLIMIKYY